MEAIIKQKMLDYLLSSNLISKHQHGFLSKRSTCSQWLKCVDDWTLALHNRYSVDVVYVDFSKAFDSVSYSKLLHKLKSFGIGGKLLLWICDYLNKRTQCVKVGNCFSNYASVGSGVPQGNVLGPLLFLLFITDICNIFGDFLSVKLFADDLKVYVVIDFTDNTERLQNGLNKLGECTEIWQINLSINKCLALHVGEQNPMSSYCISGLQQANVTETVDLGILVDTRLRFDKHVCNIVHKAHQWAALIKRCFRTRDANVLMKAFTVYVRPLLEYCSPVWNPQYVCHISNIESVQRRFTKHLTGLKNNTYITRLSKLNVDSLELRRLTSDLTLVYCIVHGLTILDCSQFLRYLIVLLVVMN